MLPPIFIIIIVAWLSYVSCVQYISRAWVGCSVFGKDPETAPVEERKNPPDRKKKKGDFGKYLETAAVEERKNPPPPTGRNRKGILESTLRPPP